MGPSRLLCLIATSLLLACQPQATETTQNAVDRDQQVESGKDIVLGSIDTIQSTILGEDRDLWVYLPRSAQESDEGQIYPVVYLLDGSGHFRSVSGMIYQLSTTNGNKVLPEMIVVGIPNTDRMRDLTPTHVDGTSGGGTAFLDFIENEVIPHVEATYPASQYRTFIGHSLGGLMAIETLITRPEVFQNYIAIDPSLWWDEQSVLHRAEAALRERDFTGKSLYVSVANTLPAGLGVDEVVTDTQDRTTHIRSILQFSRSAEADTRSGLNFDWDYYEEDTHGSVPLISEYEGFRYLFSWYSPSLKLRQYSHPDRADNPDEMLGFINGHYEAVSEKLGYTHLPPMAWVNSIANGMRFDDKPRSALAVARLNLTNYPDSPVTHETIGDYYVWQGDEAAARTHFEHAISRGAEIDIDEKFAPDPD